MFVELRIVIVVHADVVVLDHLWKEVVDLTRYIENVTDPVKQMKIHPVKYVDGAFGILERKTK